MSQTETKVDLPTLTDTIIHQTWKTETRLPRLFSFCQQTWWRDYPDWHYMFWNDDQVVDFAREYNAKLYVDVFCKTKYKIQKIDIVRYWILDHFGGLYVDMDFESLKPSEIWNHSDLVVVCEPQVHATQVYKSPQVISNAIMYSKKGHPIWQIVNDHLVDLTNLTRSEKTKIWSSNVLQSTGPGMFTRCVNVMADYLPVTILDSDFCFPEAASKWNCPSVYTARSFARHHWANSWTSQPNW